MDRDSSPKRNGCACRARLPLLYRLVVSLSKKLDFFAFFLRFYFLFLLQGKKPFPLRPAAHQPQPVRSPRKRAKTQTPRQARRKRYCFGSLIPTTPCHNKTGEIPFCNNIFSQTIAIKNVSFRPQAQEKPAAKRKANRIAAIGFPHGTPDAIRTHGLPLRRRFPIHLSYGGTDIFILSYDNWFVNLLWTWPNGT